MGGCLREREGGCVVNNSPFILKYHSMVELYWNLVIINIRQSNSETFVPDWIGSRRMKMELTFPPAACQVCGLVEVLLEIHKTRLSRKGSQVGRAISLFPPLLPQLP